MKLVAGLLLLGICSSALGHNTGGLGCNGAKERPNVIEPASFTPAEWKKIKEVEALIYGTQNILILERFSQPASPIGQSANEPTKTISWDEATRLVLMGYVTGISQTHALEVTLRSKSGRSYITKEPKIDEVFRIQELVDPCGIFINVSTE